MIDLYLRPLNSGDLREVLSLQRDAYGDSYIESAQSIEAKIALASRTSWGAFDDHGLAGYVIALPVKSDFMMPLDRIPQGVLPLAEAEILYLHDLAVGRRALKSGVGSLLFRQVFTQAANSPVRAIELVAVQKALAFWARRGFREISREVGLGYGPEAVKCALPLIIQRDGVEVRAARLQDVEALLRLGQSDPAFAVSEDIQFYEGLEIVEFLSQTDWAIGIASVEGEAAGFTSFHRMSWHWSMIENFYVEPSHRRTGVSGAMYDWLTMVALAWDARYLNCLVDVEDDKTMTWLTRRDWSPRKQYRWLDLSMSRDRA